MCRTQELVDLSPWSLLYASRTDETAAEGTPPLHEGLTITNVALGCHCRSRCGVGAPHLSLFEAPELHDGGKRSIASAMCSLGYLIHFLIVGRPRGEPVARSHSKNSNDSQASRGVEQISVDAELAIAGLTRTDPLARLSPAAFLRCAWLSTGVELSVSSK